MKKLFLYLGIETKNSDVCRVFDPKIGFLT